MKKHWLYYTTPCILASVIAIIISIIGIIDVSQSGDYRIILVSFLLPTLCISLGLDWLVKKITKDNLLYVWIIEIILIVIIYRFLPVGRLSGCWSRLSAYKLLIELLHRRTLSTC
jgi:hypothetical protein